ncbi:unnamed protein product [Rotaria sp. Silwood2]|nr:unnamed protein product [Rotaria sp. Silwood2]CAF2484516.1 unnamed protein product [Rotaria sp. Silwood2]CAF2716431.1 unnamed protein product [Rotaria sp. Silwood2]CAF2868198.1 unnamed protein product [Rotaria sp. Silwood2]CAF4161897.1 unnamed protein product [Rotaria sp. Silwood2]
MHMLHQHPKKQLICLFFILVTQTVCGPIKESVLSIRCSILRENCTLIPNNSLSNSFSSSSYSQNQTPQINRQRVTPSLTISAFRQDSTSKSRPVGDLDSFSDNLKRAALILAGIALGLGILRICLMLCKSRSPNRSFSNRHSATVRPQISTIERHQFKPDLPPAYAEAVTNIENAGGKLPSYEELPYEQRQEQQVNNSDGIISTPM